MVKLGTGAKLNDSLQPPITPKLCLGQNQYALLSPRRLWGREAATVCTAAADDTLAKQGIDAINRHER